MRTHRWFFILCFGLVAMLTLCGIQLLRSMPTARQSKRTVTKLTLDPIVQATTDSTSTSAPQPLSPTAPVSAPATPKTPPKQPVAPAPVAPPAVSPSPEKPPAKQAPPAETPAPSTEPAKTMPPSPAPKPAEPPKAPPRRPVDPAPFKPGATDVRVVKTFCTVPTSGVDFTAGAPTTLFTWKSAPESFQLRLYGPRKDAKSSSVTTKSVERAVPTGKAEELMLSFEAGTGSAAATGFDAKLTIENNDLQYYWLRRPSDTAEAAKQLAAHVVEVRTNDGSWLLALSQPVVKPAIQLTKGEGRVEMSGTPHWGNPATVHKIARGTLTVGPVGTDPTGPSSDYKLSIVGSGCRVPELERDSGIEQVSVNLYAIKLSSVESWKIDVSFTSKRQQELLALRDVDQKAMNEILRKLAIKGADIVVLNAEKNTLSKAMKDREAELFSLRAASQSHRDRVRSISFTAYIEVQDGDGRSPIRIEQVRFGEVDQGAGSS